MKLAVLLSGRGSNFDAIYRATQNGELDANIVCVISNRPGAPGVERARSFGLLTYIFDHRKYATRLEHEEDILRALSEAEPDYICLAGYMRRLSPTFVAAYPNRILNIHPSLLPAFPGVDAQKQALEAGVKESGCTVHFVDENLDAGPVILQRKVEVRPDDTVESLSARILEQEHIAYVEALKELRRQKAEGRSGVSRGG